MRLRFAFPWLLSVAAIAQQAGTFTATGNMATARWSHTATLLPTGKVLIAGGNIDTSWTSTARAELYDPSTGTFTRTGDMITGRYSHTATLLPGGKVLIAGGWSAGKGVRSAELYDPVTGTFSATGDLVQDSPPSNPGGPAKAILLANGKVWVAGELYDPVAGTFSIAGASFLGDTATLLSDGTVLLANFNAAALYDPASGAELVTGAPDPSVVYFDGPAAAPLTNGKALLSGGYSEESNVYSAGAELYDPLTGTFARTGDMTTGRAWHTTTPLGDGTILMAGNESPAASASADVYDPAAGAFSRTGSLIASRLQFHTATLLADGTVLIAGGLNNNGGAQTILASAEIYHPARPVPAPLLFSVGGDAQGQGAIWHSATGQAASADNPAIAGEALSIYTTSMVPSGVIPPQVSVGGRVAEILYFGDAPGYPGYFQVNFRVPQGMTPGAAVPVRLTYLDRSSNEVAIAVQ